MDARRSSLLVAVGSALFACAAAAESRPPKSAERAAVPANHAPGFEVVPKSARVAIDGKLQFRALVTKGADKAVTWSVLEGDAGGKLDAAGVYTPPSAAGTFHVRAVSHADNKVSASAIVTVGARASSGPTLVSGQWVAITPPGLNLSCCPGSGGNSFGLPEFDLDPSDPKTIYACVDQLGMRKTTDGGATWQLLGDPKGAIGPSRTTYLDSPIAVRVDPRDSRHLYATQGVRGKTLGFWVSRDAGATWAKPKGFVAIEAQATSDITAIAVDPANFDHFILSSHAAWAKQKNAGVLESTDGGESFVMHAPVASWPVGSFGIHFLYSPSLTTGDSRTWLVGTDGNGFWRTTDAGGTWQQVSTSANVPHGGNQIYYASNGWLYAGATPYPVRSKDNGATWEQLKQLPFAYYYSVYGDGAALYTSRSYTGSNGQEPAPYFTSAEADGIAWKEHGAHQKFADGPFQMAFDAANGILYSANWDTGLLALKVR